jgi:hypothetical protein
LWVLVIRELIQGCILADFGPELERHGEALDIIYAVGVYQLAFDSVGRLLGLSRAYDM